MHAKDKRFVKPHTGYRDKYIERTFPCHFRWLLARQFNWELVHDSDEEHMCVWIAKSAHVNQCWVTEKWHDLIVAPQTTSTYCRLWSRVLGVIPRAPCKCVDTETQVALGQLILCPVVSCLQPHPTLPLQKCNKVIFFLQVCYMQSKYFTWTFPTDFW